MLPLLLLAGHAALRGHNWAEENGVACAGEKIKKREDDEVSVLE